MVARGLTTVVGLVALCIASVLAQTSPPDDTLMGRAEAIRRALDGGRFQEAHALLAAAGSDPGTASPLGRQLLARLRVGYAIELGDWPQLAHLPIDLFSADDAALYWYARGLGAARAAWPGAQPEWVGLAREAASALEALDVQAGRPSRTTVWRVSVLAAIAAAQEERDELALLLGHAAALDERLTPEEVDLINGDGALAHLAGDLWWQVSRHADAAAAYRRAAGAGVGSPRRLLGLARALDALGEAQEARTAASAFLQRWAEADRGRPEIVEASAIAGR